MTIGAKKLLLGGRGIDPDARALIARMSPVPNAERSRSISTTITALKKAGVWSKLQCLYVLGAHSRQAAKLNWVENANNLYEIGPTADVGTFTVDRDYRYNSGNEQAGLLSPYIPNDGGKFMLGNAHLAAWAATGGNQALCGSLGNFPDPGGSGGSRSSITYFSNGIRSINSSPNYDNQNASLTGSSVTKGFGFVASDRASEGVVRFSALSNENGFASQVVGRSSDMHVPRHNLSLASYYIGDQGRVVSSGRVSAMSMGSGLSAAEANELLMIVFNHMRRLGAFQ